MQTLRQLIKEVISEVINYEDDKSLVFIRSKKFDNSTTKRSLPYEGIHCWCIYRGDIGKYASELELWGGNKEDIEIIKPSGREIQALDYNLAHKYVMGKSDELPVPEAFNPDKHRMRFLRQGPKSMLKYVGDMKYEILISR